MKHYAHLPPLPKPWASQTFVRDVLVPPFAEGCYLLNFQLLNASTVFDGTLRLECQGIALSASADVYKRTIAPNPAQGIPILPRKAYHSYWQIAEVMMTGDGVRFRFDSYIFKSAKGGSWQLDGSFEASLGNRPPPNGFKTTANYAIGNVIDLSNFRIIGRLTIGHISPHFRQATIEIDTVAGSEGPLSTTAGKDWKSVFSDCNWDVKAVLSQQNVPEISGKSWSNAELHGALLAHREKIDLDTEWRFHIMAVKNLDATERGIMYDVGATDSDKVSRAGIGIATHWTIPTTPEWGLVQGQRSGAATDVLFRTAVHEIGHALGLQHNLRDNGFMNATNTIAASATADTPFPKNVKWAFSEADKRRLRHFPDVYVRPGGTAFGAVMKTLAATGTFDEAEKPTEDVVFTAQPLMEKVPIGAPVRVELTLQNTSKNDQLLPNDISLKSGFVKGKVTNALGEERAFSSLIVCMDAEELSILRSGEKRISSLTLLRGPQGALFPEAGFYDITIDIHWENGEIHGFATTTASVNISAAESLDHAKVAKKLLATPDLLLTLVFGGDNLPKGVAALKLALKQPILRPHFVFAEVRRLVQKRDNKAGNLQKVAALMLENPVMSICETKKAAQLLG